MSHSRLLKEMDSREIAEWMAYFSIESKQDKDKSAEELKAKFQSLTVPKNGLTVPKNGANSNTKRK